MLDKKNIDKLTFIHDKLLEYFKINKHKGIDWSSIQYGEKYLNYIEHKNKFVKKVKSSLVARSFNFFGHTILSFFEPIERKYFTKAICLYLMGRLRTNHLLDKDDLELLQILKSKKINNSNLYAHDVSYKILGSNITDRTPNLVTTYFVADLYFNLYLVTNDEGYKNEFRLIIVDLLETIPFYRKSDKEICFQYTPVSHYNVHNANLLFCELLVKYNYLYLQGEYFAKNQKLIIQSLNYSISDFKNTSTYFYAGQETRNKSIDNYHTGYVLRSLNEIKTYGQNIEELNLNLEIDKLLKFYIDTFIIKGKYIYKFRLKNIESHSLAESIIVFSIFNNYIDTKTKQIYLTKIFKTINILYDNKNNKFYNKVITCIGVPIRKDKIDYIRWSQAWMFFAISLLLGNEQNDT